MLTEFKNDRCKLPAAGRRSDRRKIAHQVAGRANTKKGRGDDENEVEREEWFEESTQKRKAHLHPPFTAVHRPCSSEKKKSSPEN